MTNASPESLSVGEFELIAGISDDDGVPVVFIDGSGPVRVYVNDCAVFAQDTEQPPIIDYSALND